MTKTILERKIKPFGNTGHVTLPKKWLGRWVIIILKSEAKIKKDDPRQVVVDMREWKRREDQWDEFPKDGYYKE